MDSVEGRKSGKVLLTIYFRNSSLMLAFIHDNNTAKSVTDVFDWLYELLGHDTFTNLFQVILTDRGSEFTNTLAIEFNENKLESRIPIQPAFQYSRILIDFKSIYNDSVLTIAILMNILLLNGGVVYGND